MGTKPTTSEMMVQEEDISNHEKLREMLETVSDLQQFMLDTDPSKPRAQKFVKDMEAIALPYRTIYEEIKKRQLEKKRSLKSTVSPAATVTPPPISPPASPSPVSPSPALPLELAPPVTLHPAEDSDGDPDDPPSLPELQ